MNNNDKPAFSGRSHGINKSDLAETAHRYNIVRLEIVCVGRYNTPIYRCLTVFSQSWRTSAHAAFPPAWSAKTAHRLNTPISGWSSTEPA